MSDDQGRDESASAAAGQDPSAGTGQAAPEAAPEDAVDDAGAAADAWERQRRLAEVFGDVLPETTGDERAPGTPEAESASDAWLRAQVPPHHG